MAAIMWFSSSMLFVFVGFLWFGLLNFKLQLGFYVGVGLNLYAY